MAPFQGSVSVTYITTATAIINIDGVRFLTDPVFCPAGSEYVYDGWAKANWKEWGFQNRPPTSVLRSFDGPALQLHDIPPIDAILLSHEDHVDNLDPFGRQLLDGRRVYTTPDGAHNLQPRPGVVGLKPWQTVSAQIGGKDFRITGTPCKHFPGGEVTGFIVECESFGVDETGLPNVVYFSGDTVWIDELVEIKNKWHVSVAVLNLGNALFEYPRGMLQITFDGKQAAHFMRATGADIMVPIHFESWEHFTEHREDLQKVFDKEGIAENVCWLVPGVEKRDEDLKRVRENQRKCRQRKRDYIAELESKIAAYAEAAAEADRRRQAVEENLCRENEALRTLLASSGFGHNVPNLNTAQKQQEAILDDIQMNLSFTSNTLPTTLELHADSLALELPNVTSSFGSPTTIREVADTGLVAPSSVDFTPSQSTDLSTCLDFPGPGLHELTVPEGESRTSPLELLPPTNQSTIGLNMPIGLVDPILQDTTLCAVAIQIVRHCNKKNLSMVELDAKLRHGYRNARSPLEGCRVTNWVLLSVLAEIVQ
ncbi:hypothetical protein KXX00_006800 [Aspergillus fumigatus]|nr:hypothetical protein KXX00_006800 [Aspergillus fumigatus]KAH3313737.1 hypothetical protein KXV19_005376 [Aspergillus fumigatus]